jgi:hemolysin activation/secretion protein
MYIIKYLKINICIIFCLMIFCPLVIKAGDAGRILQQEKQLQQQKNLPKAIPKNIFDADKPVSPKDQGDKIFITKIKLKGNTIFSDAELEFIFNKSVNQELTLDEIKAIAVRITDFYRSQGYFLATALVPRQEVLDGVVEIVIYEGELDPDQPIIIQDSQVSGHVLRLHKDSVEAYFEGNDAVINQQELERDILNLQDNPGIQASANIAPGNKEGTSRVLLNVTEGPLLDGSIGADNYGSRYTGKNRVTASLNINNPSSYGDAIHLTTINGVEDPFHLHIVGYELPIGRDGLRLNANYSNLNYTLEEDLKTTPASTGEANSWAASLKYPVYRTVEKALFVGAGYDFSSIKNVTSGTTNGDKDIFSYHVNTNGQMIDQILGGGFSMLDLSYKTGHLDMNHASSDYTSDQASGGAQTNGSYQKVNMQFLRIQRGTERISLQFLYEQQWANKNLDGAEKMVLGGPAGVRAYPPGEASGDEGHRLSVDAKYNLASGTMLGDWIASIFYDYGKIHQYENPSLVTVDPNAYSLQGWGLGLDVVSAGKYTVTAGWARKLAGNPGVSDEGKDSDGLSRDSRWLINATVFF